MITTNTREAGPKQGQTYLSANGCGRAPRIGRRSRSGTSVSHIDWILPISSSPDFILLPYSPSMRTDTQTHKHNIHRQNERSTEKRHGLLNPARAPKISFAPPSSQMPAHTRRHHLVCSRSIGRSRPNRHVHGRSTALAHPLLARAPLHTCAPRSPHNTQICTHMFYTH
jgi:hypothetical protein